MGYAVLVTCVGKRETNHSFESQFLPANPMRRERERHQPEPADVQQPRHRCRVAGLWPDLSRKRAGTQQEVSWNSAKRYSAIGDQQKQDVGIALSSESEAATVQLQSG